MPDQILFVEDEPDLAAPLQFYLESLGFRVALAGTAAAARESLQRQSPDLVLLDLMLPDQSGLELCRWLRAQPVVGCVPILVASARTDEFDKLLAFEAGADDYVTKPYLLREIGARVGALLRRASRSEAPVAAERNPTGPLQIDREGRQVFVDGARVTLSAIEFRMLLTFVANPGKALDREAICYGTWGERHAISERAVDTNIRRVRKKLGRLGHLLETVHGLGYRWVGGEDGSGT